MISRQTWRATLSHHSAIDADTSFYDGSTGIHSVLDMDAAVKNHNVGANVRRLKAAKLEM